MKIYDLERPNLYQPYDPEDLLRHRTERQFRHILQHIHTQNWDLIDHVVRIRDILDGAREGMLVDVSQLFLPGEKESRNPACYYLRRLADRLIGYGEGNVPKTRLVVYASRSTVTLIDALVHLHATHHLVAARQKAERLFRMMAHEGKPTMSPESYAETIRNLVEGFIADCVANANELTVYLGDLIARRREERHKKEANAEAPTKSDIERLTATTASVAKAVAETTAAVEKGSLRVVRAVRSAKPRGKKARYSDDLQDKVHAIHVREKSNAKVRLASRTQSSHAAEFDHAYVELTGLGVKDLKTYEAILRAHTNRTSNVRRKGIRSRPST